MLKRLMLLVLTVCFYGVSAFAQNQSLMSEAGTEYIILKKLGEGGIGKVFLLREVQSGKEYAVKFVPANQEQAIAANTQALELRNRAMLVPIRMELFKTRVKLAEYGIFTEVAQEDLKNEIEELKRLEKRATSDLEREAIFRRQLEAAQQVLNNFMIVQEEMGKRNLAHNDIKPANVMRINGQWQVIDFDALLGRDKLAHIYSADYAAPEVRTRRMTYATTDLYSMGMTLGLLLLLEDMPMDLFDRQIRNRRAVQILERRFDFFVVKNPVYREAYNNLREFLNISLNPTGEDRDLQFSKWRKPTAVGLSCKWVY